MATQRQIVKLMSQITVNNHAHAMDRFHGGDATWRPERPLPDRSSWRRLGTLNGMMALPEDPDAPVPEDLDEAGSAAYERRTCDALRAVLMQDRGGLLAVDTVELHGSRPDTLVVFRYHHREQYVGRDPALPPGPRAEIARLWEFAGWSRWGGMIDSPELLAGAIGGAFEAAELTLVDPQSLEPIGSPPRIYPRTYDIQRPVPD